MSPEELLTIAREMDDKDLIKDVEYYISKGLLRSVEGVIINSLTGELTSIGEDD